jgi:hypothetical protein
MITPDRLVLLALVGIIGTAAAFYFYRDLIWPVKSNASAGGADRRQLAGDQVSRRPGGQRSKIVQRSHRVNRGSPRHNALNATVQRSAVERSEIAHTDQTSATDVITLSSKELTQLAQALITYGKTGVEQKAIETGFECTKGGSKRWARGKQLFDLARGTATH